MNTVNDFIALLERELGLLVTEADIGEDLDQIPGWDSMHLLTLLGALEQSTGRPISLPQVLEAGSLEEIYSLTVPR